MREAAGHMQLSLVMPNLFDHGAGERRFGDLIRIDNDASFGTGYNLSGGRQTWQPNGPSGTTLSSGSRGSRTSRAPVR